MDKKRRFWTLIQIDRSDPEISRTFGYGRTREEALDDFLIRWVDDNQDTFGREGTEEYDPEGMESAMAWGNEVHGFFYANPELDDMHDESGYIWNVSWDYAPAWMESSCLEEWVMPTTPNGLNGYWKTNTPAA